MPTTPSPSLPLTTATSNGPMAPPRRSRCRAHSAEIDALTTDAFSITSIGGDQNGWQYSAAQNLDFLRKGETLTLSFNVVAIDDSGAGNNTSAPVETVTITLTGTNDQPEISAITQTGAANEADGAAQLTATGQITWDDLDANDIVTITPTYNGDLSWSGGTDADLAAELTPPQLDALTTENGAFSITSVGGDQNGWQYSAAQNLDFLREGETLTLSFDVVAIDDSGAGNNTSAPVETVTITLTGTNDQPEISAITQTGAANELDGAARLTATGQITWDDLDANDTVTITPTYNGDITWSGGTRLSTTPISLPSSLPPKSTNALTRHDRNGRLLHHLDRR